MTTHSNLPLTRLKRAKQHRYNPLPNITDPAVLTRKLDAFDTGYPKESVNISDSLEQRDDLIPKRKKAIGRQGWTILMDDIVPAERRAEAPPVYHFLRKCLQCPQMTSIL